MRRQYFVIRYDPEKSAWLRRTRGVSFEEIITLIKNDEMLAVIDHPNQKKYAHQKMFLFLINGYCYTVPFVEDDSGEIFLKTLMADRKLNKKFGVIL